MKESSITIKPIVDMDGCRNLQEVHKRIWTGSGGIETIAVHVLITWAKNGSLVLGAYDSAGPEETGGMVGFIIGWLGTIPPEAGSEEPPCLKHCSHIAGVLPEWQGRGVGVQLKLAQREAVLAEGLTDHTTWTYDPLYWVNGRMNIHRLGAICTTYKRNVYGVMDDALNAGAPTDRCQVDWYLGSARVRHAITPERQDPVWDLAQAQRIAIRLTAQSLPEPESRPLTYAGDLVLLPLPDDMAALRTQSPALLNTWRFFTREVFEAAFAAGYALVDCIHLPEHGWHYILAPLPKVQAVEGDWP